MLKANKLAASYRSRHLSHYVTAFWKCVSTGRETLSSVNVLPSFGTNSPRVARLPAQIFETSIFTTLFSRALIGPEH
jgi:hypothetical protein